MPARFPQFPLADADKCVKCAMCLPHCPTWRETRNEAESPRGRIALMQGFATGKLELTPQLTAHLDRCLECRACEAMCPAEVPYGKLIDAAHTVLQSQGYRESLLARMLAWWLTGPWRLRLLHFALWLSQRLGLPKLAGISKSLRRLTHLLPTVRLPGRRHHTYPAAGTKRGAVNLFLGCIARISEPRVTDAAIAVLNAAGYDVRIPAAQTCCGAMDQHAGRQQTARRLANANCTAFSQDSDPVLSTASGCGATLNDYARLTDDPSAATLAARHHDIGQFLGASGVLDNVRFEPWPATVVLHHPCTLRNVLKSDRDTLAMLQRIPELNIRVLPASSGCCGAAGSYLLNQPAMADRLADKLADMIVQVQARALVTSNVGCAMHLAATLARKGHALRVMHPLEVLAQQLPNTGRV